jgi:hypothetical protein
MESPHPGDGPVPEELAAAGSGAAPGGAAAVSSIEQELRVGLRLHRRVERGEGGHALMVQWGAGGTTTSGG